MQTFLRTLFVSQALTCVTMKSKAESVFTGTEGGSVDISCKYTDGYQFTPMYLCRDPCAYSDVVIKTEKADIVTSKGRYSALNTVSARSFSVTIRHLTLKDSGVYHCGLETWGPDTLIKVKLNISKVPTVSTPAPVSRQIQHSEFTQLPHATTVRTATAETSMSYKQAYSTFQTQHSLNPQGQLLVVCGGLLGLVLYCGPAALVFLYRRATNSQSTSCYLLPAPEKQMPPLPPYQEDICHVYYEMLAEDSLPGPVIGNDSSVIYCTIQLSDNNHSP